MHRSADSSSTGTATYKLKAVGQKFIGGISSRYENKYDRMLENVVSERELARIVEDLNEVIVSHWPCATCYLYGYLCLPCTLGMSLLAPGFCVNQAELQAHKCLRNVSLAAKFYDKEISFVLVKGLCDSHVEVRFPSHLLPRNMSGGDLESGGGGDAAVEDAHVLQPGRASEMSPLLNTISGGRRIKDN